ncbi:hypothetical protein Tco_0505055 [Tanacetum coccineum]
MSSYNHFGCSWCGGPFNGRNYPGCSSVGSGNEFVYDPNPYFYNETPNFFNQHPQHQYETYSCEVCEGSPYYGFACQTRTPLVYEQDSCSNQNFSIDQSPYYSMSLPQHFDCCEYCGGLHDSSNCQSRNPFFYEPNPCNNFNSSGYDQPPFYSPSLQQQFDCCEVCGGPHYSSDCQTRNPLVNEPTPCNNYDFSCFDPPPEHPIVHPPLHEMSLQELISYLPPSIAETANHHMQRLDELQSEIDSMMINLGTFIHEPLVNSVVYKESDDDIKVTLDKEQFLSDHYIAYVTPPAYTPSLPFLATMEPTDTLLIGDEVISTILVREIDEFIKSSVDDLFPILRESEVTSDSNSECDIPTPLPTTDVRKEDFDINSPLGEQVVDFLMENEDVAGLPRHLVKQLLVI